MTTLAIIDGSAELQKRCEETSKKLRAKKAHILDGGGNVWRKNECTLIRVPSHLMDEFIAHAQEKFGIKYKAGTPEVVK